MTQNVEILKTQIKNMLLDLSKGKKDQIFLKQKYSILFDASSSLFMFLIDEKITEKDMNFIDGMLSKLETIENSNDKKIALENTTREVNAELTETYLEPIVKRVKKL